MIKDPVAPPDAQAKKELSQAYSYMCSSMAWKHFEEFILKRIQEQATKDEDAITLDNLTTAKIAECRGRRHAVAKILLDVDYVINGIR